MSYADVTTQLKTIRDYLRWASSRFSEAGLEFGHGTDNAWDDAVQLLCFALHLPIDSAREVLDACLTQPEREQMVRLIERRIVERKPVAYMTHRAWFAGLEFYVDERVLIPRSPIAELIEQHFSPWITEEPQTILDLCTGGGCIAIATAVAFPEAKVDAVDIDNDALAVAKINVERFGLQEQLRLLQSDLFSGLGGQQYDLIVTNPPYVSEETIENLSQEFHHEPYKAFAGKGDDGLAIVQKILIAAPEFLTDEGVLICEVGDSDELLQARFPSVPFIWLEFSHGGSGVFVLNKAQLQEYAGEFV
ncbi:MAG: 50S ribosomal protein L3 N(5)-glutamine methyltransferase [Pseudomonadota bacterium]|nr:50S ribosomal protein L3 N(5)-glutamine methyltransferase [Pseudomonadota bacterium]